MIRDTFDMRRCAVFLVCLTVAFVTALQAQDIEPLPPVEDGDAPVNDNQALEFLMNDADDGEMDAVEPEAEVPDLFFDAPADDPEALDWDQPEEAQAVDLELDDWDAPQEAPAADPEPLDWDAPQEAPDVEPEPLDWDAPQDQPQDEPEDEPRDVEEVWIPDFIEDDQEAAQLIAAQEEIRRQAEEIEGRRRIAEAREAADRGEYRQALRLYDAGLQRLPVRRDTEALRRSVQQERIDARYRLLMDVVAAVETRDAAVSARDQVREALREAPDHRGLQRLIRRAERQVDRLRPPPAPPDYESEDVRERRERVRELMDDARGFLRTMDFVSARERFESVLSLEPDNVEAMRYLRELHEQRYLVSSLERDATTRDMMATVRDTWRPREYEVIDVERPRVEPDAPDVGILEKLERIVIPQIEFRQANIHDVVDFLVRASIDEDPEPDPDQRGVNIILNLGRDAPRREPDFVMPDDPFADLDRDRRPRAAPRPGEDITVTFTARFITLKQALDIITRVAGLKYHIEGNVVMIVPHDYVVDRIIHRMYPVEPSLIERVRDEPPTARRDPGPFQTMTPAQLDREREPVRDFFEQMGVPFPPGSSIAYRPSVGQLVMANTAENHEIFRRILQEVDVVPNQVEIEARFVEVNQTDLEEFGLQWLLDDNWQMLQRRGQDHLPVSARQRIEMQANAHRGGFTRGLRFGSADAEMPVGGGAGTLGSLMTISSVLTNPEFSMIINALAQKGHADVLSAPKVTTRAGQEASIRVVTEYIYPTDYDIREITGSIDGQAVVVDAFAIPTMFETREVGVILSVLPEVSPDDNTINLTLRPEVTDEPIWRNYGAVVRRPDGSEQQTNMEQPFFPTRTLNTQISIYDGATVVMGGLITEHLISADDKIPFLGDLPLLGRFFRSSYKRSEKRNLLIFVTARLVDPAGQSVRERRGRDMATPPLDE